MDFKKIRLHGFKSFVDQTELLIEPGITGVVGPNGCGKSNVIESLRWVMGETSAKRMRGGEMDDVIFGGSSTRAQRNSAEVSVVLNNQERDAPAAYNDVDEIEITRRIDRGQGSTYRINGKEVRARDVQLLFADLASGANSTAIVSQGRVGALIGAKPTERRTLLEEAAGIRGLHSRRHEAELRLRAAEANLERLEDVIGALESQSAGLQRQARQANRYRRISEQLRRQEAIQLHLRWTAAQAAVEVAKARLQEAEQAVYERTEAAASAAKRQADAQTALPELRRQEAEAAAELQRLKLAERELDQEENRLLERQETLTQRLEQLAADIEREGQLKSDAESALERLAAERAEIAAAQAGEAEAAEAAHRAREAADAAVAGKEAELQELTEHVAGVDAQRASLTRRIEEGRQRLERIAARRSTLAEERRGLESDVAQAGDIEGARAAAEAAEAALAEAEAASARADEESAAKTDAASRLRDEVAEAERTSREAIETAIVEARRRLDEIERAARDRVSQADKAHSALATEEQTLSRLLARDAEDQYPPAIDKVTVDGGFEAALGAALGEDLDAALEEAAASHWRDLPPLSHAPELPSGATPLSAYVRAPKALARRLSQIGVVAAFEDGERLHPDLAPGQRLVSRDGGFWRWDGLTVRPGAETPAARRLEQRNRLAELTEQRAEAERALERVRTQAEAELAEARAANERAAEDARAKAEADIQAMVEARDAALAAESDAVEAARAARSAYAQAFQAVNDARQELSTLENRSAAARSRLDSITEEEERLAADEVEAKETIDAADSALKVLEDPSAARERVARMRTQLAELRTDQVEKRGAHEQLKREAEARARRLESISGEERGWRERAEGAGRRMADLDARKTEAEQGLVEIESRPAEIAAQRDGLLTQIAESDTRRNAAAEALAKAEAEQVEADRDLRRVEGGLAEAREIRVRREAEVETAEQAAGVVADQIAEKLEVRPDEALGIAELEEDARLPALDEVDSKIERLKRERDNIGPVNLRAEQEASELSQQIESMTNEREDLLAAIARLRQGINALNREGRERLLAAFEKVDAHFRELFVRLFGGGEAKLTLTESDDPLEAGLEIMASPPGKKMQILSLLSGGEQALTALALLFGVFLTNPAPICVLDEVDAPLDDSNVDRFCTLLDEIAHNGTTRFLIVTHHRLTMARVDRLFGVTMAERGISQLVSVDLTQAVRLRESA
ncbi:MAG: AAA family ATPase [Marivibrio sp.]|uniref:AAA family ATPase n=1 Tax=Marivibrio sp. TaxID=2039719 RepID=UPI0032EC4200